MLCLLDPVPEVRPRSEALEPERFAGGVRGCTAGAVALGAGIDVLGADVGRRVLPVGRERCVAWRLVPIDGLRVVPVPLSR